MSRPAGSEVNATTRDRTSVLNPIRSARPVFNISQTNTSIDDRGNFAFRGTSRKANHFKISHVNTTVHFKRTDGDIAAVAHYISEEENKAPVEHGTENFSIPANLTTHDQVADWFLLNNLTEVDLYSPNYGTNRLVNLDIPFPDDVITPLGSKNVSTLEITHNTSTPKYCLTPEGEDRTWDNGDIITIPQQPQRNLSLYYSTGDTEEPDWHIGDMVTRDNPHHQIFTQETIRQGYHPISKTKNLQISLRDARTGVPVYKNELDNGTSINLHTQLTFL